jgi:hypothetical protein
MNVERKVTKERYSTIFVILPSKQIIEKVDNLFEGSNSILLIRAQFADLTLSDTDHAFSHSHHVWWAQR